MSENKGRIAIMQLTKLREAFDLMRKEFSGIPDAGKSLKEFAHSLALAVDKATRGAGINPFPMVIDRKLSRPRPIEEILDKGGAFKRKDTV